MQERMDQRLRMVARSSLRMQLCGIYVSCHGCPLAPDICRSTLASMDGLRRTLLVDSSSECVRFQDYSAIQPVHMYS